MLQDIHMEGNISQVIRYPVIKPHRERTCNTIPQEDNGIGAHTVDVQHQTCIDVNNDGSGKLRVVKRHRMPHCTSRQVSGPKVCLTIAVAQSDTRVRYASTRSCWILRCQAHSNGSANGLITVKQYR